VPPAEPITKSLRNDLALVAAEVVTKGKLIQQILYTYDGQFVQRSLLISQLFQPTVVDGMSLCVLGISVHQYWLNNNIFMVHLDYVLILRRERERGSRAPSREKESPFKFIPYREGGAFIYQA
jgi:hypothetical protein